MSIHKDKNSGTWYVKYQNKTKRGFDNKNEAMRYQAQEILSEDKCENVKHRYKDIANDFLIYSKNNLAYGTYKKNEVLFRTIIFKIVGDVDIEDISRLDCEAFKNKIVPLKYSTRYKNDILTRYKAVFKYAHKYGIIENDPSVVLSKIKKSYEENIKDRNKDFNVWTVEEFQKFVCAEENERLKALFIVLYFGGLRIGEAQALRWFDYDGDKLSIYKSLSKKAENKPYEIKNPKTASSVREVKMSQSINKYLMKYKAKEMTKVGFSENWYMFGDIYPPTESTISRHKNKNIELSGVRKIRIHDFRHSHASNLIADGVNIVAVSKRLGHKDVSITLSTYTHLLEKNSDELIIKLEENSKNLLKNLLNFDDLD